MTPASIGPAGAAHARELAGVAERSFDDPWSEESFRKELERPRTLALRASSGPTAVGYALGWRVLDEAELQSIAVLPEWRRDGLGRALLAAFCAELQAEGVVRVRLEVRESNRAARRLYDGFGMRRDGERPRCYRPRDPALPRETAVLYGVALR